MRFFAASESVYEQVRSALDAAWGLPSAGQQTCFAPAAIAPRTASGLVVLAVKAEFCEFDAVSAMLPGLLASGAVSEISEQEYRACKGVPTVWA